MEQEECEYTANEALLDGARYGELEEIEQALAEGADINFKDDGGNTALHKACANNHLEVVKLLIAKGATFQFNENNNSPLHWSIQNKAVAVVQHILTHCPDADVLKQNSFGKSCLSEAFNAESIEILNAVLSHSSAKGLEDQYAGGAAAEGASSGAAGADGDSGSGSSAYPGEQTPDEASASDDHQHPRDSKITQTLVHLFSFDGTEERPVYVREVMTDWTGAVFSTDSSRDTTGTHVWASAVLFSQYLFEHRDLFTAKSVCELGAGCGLPGLTVSRYGAPQKVLLTDFFDHTVKNLKHNADKNHLSPALDLGVSTLDWGARRTYPAGVFDVVLGCDLIYDAALVPLLVNCIDAILSPDGVFLYCFGASRHGGEELLESLLKSGFVLANKTPASALTRNPLVGKTTDELHVYFNELDDNVYTIVEFHRSSASESPDRAARRAELEELVRRHQEAKLTDSGSAE